MATYLLAWNPKNWAWPDLDTAISEIAKTGSWEAEWSSGTTRSITPGSRFYLIRLGQEPRGIVGAGEILTSPQEQSHWDKSKGEGATALKIKVRFDSLSRAPYVRRNELDRPPFDGETWDIHASGVALSESVVDHLGSLWHSRLNTHADNPAHLSKGVVEHWSELWSEAQQDTAWIERHRLRDNKRKSVLPEMRELVQGFLAGDVDVEDFRETFDKKTRNEWDLFGLKGLSGAMFLNKLVKHLSDMSALTEQLKTCLAVPQNEAAARKQLDGLHAYLAKEIASGVTTTQALQPNRASFFVSSCWHIQDAEPWPIMYQSARQALQLEGLLGTDLKGADGYLEFHRVFVGLRNALGISGWDLEHLCARIVDAAKDPIWGGGDDGGDGGGDGGEAQEESIWLIAPGRGASEWDEFYEKGIIAIGWDFLGDLAQYADQDAMRLAIREHDGGKKNPVQQALACFQFAQEMEIGDTVFAKRGRSEIVGYGVVTSEYRHEPGREKFMHVRSINWKKRGEWVPRDKPLVMKTLTEIGKYPGLVADIRRALQIDGDGDDPQKPPAPSQKYEMEDALRDLFLSEAKIDEALQLLKYKKNLILQGPPGVGKTFFAKRLAYLLLGEKDPEHIAQVQFHQSYAYEDFIQGYRPNASGKFGRHDGPFLRFCELALQDQSVPYVFVIDEINRGNLSKVFGELLLLIEADKRDASWATSLTYSTAEDAPFFIPPNVHIIGTMNTADRSLAMIDYALRRRFAFLQIDPAFHSDSFAQKLSRIGVEQALATRLKNRFAALNRRILADANLGEGFCIGHSYFCQTAKDVSPDDDWYRRIVRTEINPLLSEYWFDNRERADEEASQLLDDD